MSVRTDNPMPADERLWRRRSLGLLGILLPVALGAASYESVQRWWAGRDLIAREVAVGASADFGGARWRLHGLRMAELPAGGKIPPDAMGVVADFRVQVLDADLPKNWRGCAIALQDNQGRRWSTTQALPLPRSEARECVLTVYSGAQPGATLHIRHAFLVPRDVAGQLRVTVTLAPQRPYYLRFAQAPTRVP